MNLAHVRHQAGRYYTDRVVGLLVKTRLTPNSLTLIGFALSGAAGAVVAKEHLVLGGVLVLVSGVGVGRSGPLTAPCSGCSEAAGGASGAAPSGFSPGQPTSRAWHMPQDIQP